MDFYKIKTKRNSGKQIVEVYPELIVKKSSDLMIKGRAFYAVWNESKNMWSKDITDAIKMIDRDIGLKVEELTKKKGDEEVSVVGKFLGEFNNGGWSSFNKYLTLLPDHFTPLDMTVTYANTEVKKEDYVSKRLDYSIEPGPCPAYEELMSVLYDETERTKLEWAIGSIIAGDSKKIQKFFVLYGEGGTGKSTILNIIEKLFPGYYTVFDAKDLTSNNGQFATEPLKDNPLIGIQQDGDLSRIEDNTKLNSIISHEEVVINEKHKNTYKLRMNPMLFLGTNSPVKITNAKSGIIRRLVDVCPTGRTLGYDRYMTLFDQIDFELGQIAAHCLEVYNRLGINYYGNYRSRNMILATNEFFNFVVDNEDKFTENGGITVKNAYAIYQTYCDEAGLQYKMPRYRFASEIKNYFKNFDEKCYINGVQVRSWLSDFVVDKFRTKEVEKDPVGYFMKLDQDFSLFDTQYDFIAAAYAKTEDGGPRIENWQTCETKLSQIDTKKVHFCRPPDNLIVIDFDIKDEDGNKNAAMNLAEASKWPPTYAEFSKSGGGIHLHYLYNGDPRKLKRIYSDGIEIKTFTGGQSLRRKLSKCNNLPIATISSGLPLKEVEETLDDYTVKDELHLRKRIAKRMLKADGMSTHQTINLIKQDLDEAYANPDLHYDLSDMKPDILAFANNATNSAQECVRTFMRMHFASDETGEPVDYKGEAPLVFFDIEVYPNLLLLVWKIAGEGHECQVVYNPSKVFLEQFFKMRLVGYNNLRYDNGILYVRYLGYDNRGCYDLSKGIIDGTLRAPAEAANVSYTDVYDFCRKKQSLKKWEVELKMKHDEMDLPWNEDAPEDMWPRIAEYCKNDVIATEAVFNANYSDFEIREMLVDYCHAVGVDATVNNTTNQLTAKLITRGAKRPQSKYVYTDLSTIYPGYEFKNGRSSYKGIDPGEGGYVFAKPGMYTNVICLDADSMHPHSALKLNYFGEFTPNYQELVTLRMKVKSKQFDEVKQMYNGAFAKYLDDESKAKAFGDALKLAINSVYGMTAAHFPNALRHEDNKDNIIAKYGALFMINLKEEVEARGFEVVHVKTDSIKIVNATDEIIKFVNDYAKDYGFHFKIEANYERFCLVNNAVYIAKEMNGPWEPTGAQFAHKYVFKKLFSHEPIEFDDLTEIKNVTSQMYLDFNEADPENHSYYFIGKVGRFCPVKPGTGGGELMRFKDDKYSAVTGTKGFRWKESWVVESFDLKDQIDYSYFDNLVEDAIETISKFGDFEAFVAESEEEEISHVA